MKRSGRGRRTGTKGQLLVEALFSLALLFSLIPPFIAFIRISELNLKTMEIARLGTLLQSSGVVSNDQVLKELNLLTAHSRHLTGVEWSYEIGPYKEIPAAVFYNFVFTKVRYEFKNTMLFRLGWGKIAHEKQVVAQKSPIEEGT